MPSSITHTYFGIDVYNKLNKRERKNIENSLEYFKTFCQGPDVLYFYNIFIGKKAKNVNKLGFRMHAEETRLFFINIVKYIIDNNLENNSFAMAFLYGHMCHYFLDTTCHPFIYYKTGKLVKGDKSTYKYNTKHHDM